MNRLNLFNFRCRQVVRIGFIFTMVDCGLAKLSYISLYDKQKSNRKGWDVNPAVSLHCEAQ